MGAGRPTGGPGPAHGERPKALETLSFAVRGLSAA
eukprot:CAMPEP_0170427528 /NCGR_PEP_ID=MMETSP0117_2-20130122/39274_1 /TAXON_ID=400756 /ORGANISM="Durinskia baltica, Strain CSIRO CS-38" /LENGTH=34 /DNA_ID= /DNA_START= /DNA_END= /DNA_ORIENTATION=